MRTVLPLCIALSATSAAAGQQAPAEPAARPARDWSIAAGPAVLAVPRYPGSERLRVLPVPAFDVRYRDLFFASVQSGVGFNLIRAGPFTAGPIGRPDFGRRARDGRRDLGGLGRVGFAPELGGFAELGLGPSITIRAEGRQAISGHEGFVADFSANYARPVFGRSFLALGPRLRVTDARYQRSYFGVTSDEAAATGLPVFRPGGGLASVGFGGALVTPLTRRFDLAVAAGYDRLLDGPARSPVVRRPGGSRDQPSFALSLTYSFTGRARP